jgi:multiple sugar transport system permease protein
MLAEQTLPSVERESLKSPESLATRMSRWADDHMAWVLAGPALILITLMVAGPVIFTIWMSFTGARGAVGINSGFVGIDNYVKLLTDTQRFWPAVGRTITFTVSAVLIELVLGMGIALLLRKPFRGERLVRMIVLLPVVATPVAIGMMWLLMFEPTIGFANELLSWFGLPPQGWISDPGQALPTLIFVDVWQWTPMVALILLAGLTTVPEEIDEAARVDGANAGQRFWHITVPTIRPVIITAILLRAIDALKTFDILYATKGKGGGSSHEVETLNVYGYTLSFDYNQYGLSSAMLVLFLLLISGVCVVLVRNTHVKGGGDK